MLKARMKKVRICNNHLAHLFEAIQHSDLTTVRKIEHELTKEEECVACAYAAKAVGTTREELIKFLQKEGFALEIPNRETVLDLFLYWTFRIGVLIGLFLLFFALERSSLVFIFKRGSVDVLTLGAFEFITLLVTSVLGFLYIENTFLD